jgi:flagellar biosynthesis protein FlhF
MNGNGTVNGTSTTIRRYRGRTVAELLPKIQAELGPNAVVVGRRSGLEGGIAGFFQRPFVELEAKAGGEGVDLTDGEAAVPVPEQPQSQPAEAKEQPTNGNNGEEQFALALEAFEAEFAADSKADLAADPGPNREPWTAVRSERARNQLLAELVGKGFSEPFAQRLIARAEAGILALSPKESLRGAVRRALARELPSLPLPPFPHLACVVGAGGAGKSTLIELLASRYQATVGVAVRIATLTPQPSGPRLSFHEGPTVGLAESDRQTLERIRAEGVVLVEVAGVGPTASGQIKALAHFLGFLSPARLYLALPATLAPRAAQRQLEAFRPLSPNAVVITHGEEGEQLGISFEAAVQAGLGIELLLCGRRGKGQLHPVDGDSLARRILP